MLIRTASTEWEISLAERETSGAEEETNGAGSILTALGWIEALEVAGPSRQL